MDIRGKSHAKDRTFALMVWVGTIGGTPPTPDPDPNVTPPAANRIIRYPTREGLLTMGNIRLNRHFPGDGTSMQCQHWFYDDTQARWINLMGPQTTSAPTNLSTLIISSLPGTKFFVQITANTGVTALGYNFT